MLRTIFRSSSIVSGTPSMSVSPFQITPIEDIIFKWESKNQLSEWNREIDLHGTQGPDKETQGNTRTSLYLCMTRWAYFIQNKWLYYQIRKHKDKFVSVYDLSQE
jgi:hypothetical protein